MKEDVLEQIVEDYLQRNGYFTQHNVRFRPSPKHPDYVQRNDSVHSDIDIIGVNPRKRGPARVLVISCKSWQSGFQAATRLKSLNENDPKLWKHHRELWVPKWAAAFRDKVEELTGSTSFSYRLAVTRLIGDPEPWINDAHIRQMLGGNPFKFLTLEEIWKRMLEGSETTLATSEIGRLVQLLKAAQLITDSELEGAYSE